MKNFLAIIVVSAVFCAGDTFVQVDYADDALVSANLFFTDEYVETGAKIKAKFVSTFDPSKNTLKEELQKFDAALIAVRPKYEELFELYPDEAQRLHDSILYSFASAVSPKTKEYAKIYSKPFQAEVNAAVKKIMKKYKPQDADDIMNVGMKIFADTMEAISLRHEDFIDKFPEYYDALRSIKRYALTQDFFLSLHKKDAQRGAAKYKKGLWLQYAKTLRRILDDVGMILFFGASDYGIKSVNFFLDPTLGARLNDVAAKNAEILKALDGDAKKSCEKEVYHKYKAAVKELVDQYEDIKVKQESLGGGALGFDDVGKQEEPTADERESVNILELEETAY